MFRKRWFKAIILSLLPLLPLLFLACEDLEGEEGADDVVATFAELEAALGCNSEISDYLDDTLESCIEEAAAVADCFSANRSGCYCEGGDGRINCEGTFKENEGPTELGIPCASVVNASDACMPDEEE